MSWHDTKVKFEWREIATVEGENEPRLLIPHADPMQYETAIDFQFDSPEKAEEFLKDWDLEEEAQAEGWVLVQVTTAPIFQKSVMQSRFPVQGDSPN